MIKWHCDFNIPDSDIQLDFAYIKVIDYINIDDTSEVNVQISNFDNTIIVREYTQNFNRNFNNVQEIYKELLTNFSNSEMYVS